MVEPNNPTPEGKSFTWARINAYGLLLVGLLLMAVFQFLEPDSSVIARAIGQVPPLQAYWQCAYFLSGVLMLLGFIFANTLPETAGVVLMCVSLTVQTVATAIYLGPLDIHSLTQDLTWAIVIVVCVLRLSTFLSPHGLTVKIPGRKEK